MTMSYFFLMFCEGQVGKGCEETSHKERVSELGRKENEIVNY